MRRGRYRTTVENSVTNGARQMMRLTYIYAHIRIMRTPGHRTWLNERDSTRAEAY